MTDRIALPPELRWAIETGDCFDRLPGLPERSVDHAIIDPPYSQHVHSKSRAGARKQPLKDGNGRLSRCALSREVDFGFPPITQAQVDSLAQHLARIVRRWTLIFSDIESCHVWRTALTAAGLDYCRTMPWIKIGGAPQFTGDRPGVACEVITVAHPKGRKRWNGGGKLGVYSHVTCIERGGKADTNDRRVHPTQKPLALMLDLVADFTDTGEIVLDTHCGSGTTLVAALRLGRRALGYELAPNWAAEASDRCEYEVANTTPEAAKANQIPLFGGGNV